MIFHAIAKDQHSVWSWGNVRLLGEPSLRNFCPLESKEMQLLKKHMIFHAMAKNQHRVWSLGNVRLF